MPDQGFQYVKLPDGSYGKFAASAPDDVIRTQIQHDYPDAFRSGVSPIPPPKFNGGGVPAPPEVDLMGDTVHSLPDQLAGMVKQSAIGMARVSGPNVLYQLGRKALKKAPDTRYGMGMPDAGEVVTTGLGMLAGADEPMPRTATLGDAAVAASERPSVRPPAVRSSGVVTGRGVPSAATGAASPLRDIMDVLKPSIGHRMDAASNLLKRFGGKGAEGATEPALSDTATPGDRGGFPHPTDTENAASFQSKQYTDALGSTRSGEVTGRGYNSSAGEANPPHDPQPTHTPSGGSRLTLQKAPTGAEDPAEYTRRTGRAAEPAPATPGVGDNKVPASKRASTLIKKADQEKTAARVEGRGAAKEKLEKSQPPTQPPPANGSRGLGDVQDDQGVKQDMEQKIRQHHVQPYGSVAEQRPGASKLRRVKWASKASAAASSQP